ncbi:hypothetical protein JJD41_02665 [Oxynema sp. CENA135]|uniref:hypothetical protein n=1 Tax=Oxynema sp. CENA135 TaxID=984206 RepID=UPI00190BA5D7|nr:hypothetical protein [Oxynema sp. CENA135]MBK4728793.1 hypothetical protein [Oxynema sp. CENA135]
MVVVCELTVANGLLSPTVCFLTYPTIDVRRSGVLTLGQDKDRCGLDPEASYRVGSDRY